ncbi:MAG: 4-hydroxybenzoate octaprenyltransferase [Halioglobus sp.]
MHSTAKPVALLQLTRFDKPIGTLLLLWPTLWALWIASGGIPDLKLLGIFTLGTLLMRSAGCVVNDIADRNFDGFVARTQQRPLVTGAVSVTEACALLLVLLMLAFGLVLMTNRLTVQLSVIALLLACTYPFMKRYTHLPQVVLGAAFSFSIPMAFTAARGELPAALWLLYLGNLLWTVAYDTQYAMVDREDDLKIGVKSTAVLVGRYDRLFIAVLQVSALVLLALAGQAFNLEWVYYLGLIGAAAIFVYHQYLIRDRDPALCFKAFLNNSNAGAVIFVGIALHYLLQNL